MKRVFALTVLIATLMLYRRPGGILTPTLYFEDGQTFLEQQILSNNPLLLFMPFVHGALGDAYYLFLTKFIVLIASLIPEKFIPYLMNGAGILIASFSSAIFSHRFFRRIIKSDLLRVFICILIGVNLDGGEFLGTTTNFFWALGIPLLLLIISFPQNAEELSEKNNHRNYSKVLFCTTGIIAISTPLSGMLFPFAILKLALKKVRILTSAHIALVFGGIFQLLINKFYSNPTSEIVLPTFIQGYTAFFNGLSYHIILPIFFGYDVSVLLMKKETGVYFALALFLLLIFLVIIRLFKQKEFSHSLIFILSALGLSLLIFTVSFFKRSLWHFLYVTNDAFQWGGPRYYFCSRFLIVVVVFWLVDRAFKKEKMKVILTCSLFGFSAFSGFYLKEKIPPKDINWFNYSDSIKDWRNDVLKGEVKEVRVPIFSSEVWRLLLPSSELDYRKWNWQVDFFDNKDSFKLTLINPVVSRDLMLTNGKSLLIRSELNFLCDFPVPAKLVVKTIDSYGTQHRKVIKFKKCNSVKHFEIELEDSTRRGLNLEMIFSGAGGEVLIKNLVLFYKESN